MDSCIYFRIWAYCSRNSLQTFCHSILQVLYSEMTCSVFSNIGSSSHFMATCAEVAFPGGGTCLEQLRPLMGSYPHRVLCGHSRDSGYMTCSISSLPSRTFLFLSSAFSLYPTPHVWVLSPCPASSH